MDRSLSNGSGLSGHSAAEPALAGAAPFEVVIPARHGSTRLPGKPLLPLAGKPLLQHVVERARASAARSVTVATDDPRILELCASLGVPALMTDPGHRSGTERIAEVIERRGWDAETLVVNLQGDEPDMPPGLLNQVAANLAAHPGLGMATLATPIQDSDRLFDPNVVKVVTDAAGFALYFSRAPIPWQRDGELRASPRLPDGGGFLRHVGLYAYRAGFVRRYLDWPASPLEECESLEQLRVLWHGERIHVGLTATPPGPGVDTAADLARAAARLTGGLSLSSP